MRVIAPRGTRKFFTLYAVESGSMEPSLPKGSIIAVKRLAAEDVVAA